MYLVKVSNALPSSDVLQQQNFQLGLHDHSENQIKLLKQNCTQIQYPQCNSVTGSTNWLSAKESPAGGDALFNCVSVSISFITDKTLIPLQLMHQNLFSENSWQQEGGTANN